MTTESSAVAGEVLDAEPELKKESWFRRNGHIVFWGSVVALPVMNVTAAYLNYRSSVNNLEIARIQDFKDAVEQLAESDILPK